MCFGGGGGDSKIAKQQRADEVARQKRIKQGMAAIDAAFSGTGAGVNPATSYDPSKTYYNADGSVYQPMDVGSQMASGPLAFWRRAQDGDLGVRTKDLIAQGKLFTDVDRHGGFDDDFYKKRADDYVAYATPTLERQEKQARDGLVYALSRTGNLDSSAAIKRNADLTDEANTQRINVANAGQDEGNKLRANVENVRGNLVSELNATGDNEAAAASALRQVQNLNQPAGFSPLGELFASFANSLSTIGANAGNNYGGFAGTGNRGLFSSSGGSQRVVR